MYLGTYFCWRCRRVEHVLRAELSRLVQTGNQLGQLLETLAETVTASNRTRTESCQSNQHVAKKAVKDPQQKKHASQVRISFPGCPEHYDTQASIATQEVSLQPMTPSRACQERPLGGREMCEASKRESGTWTLGYPQSQPRACTPVNLEYSCTGGLASLNVSCQWHQAGQQPKDQTNIFSGTLMGLSKVMDKYKTAMQKLGANQEVLAQSGTSAQESVRVTDTFKHDKSVELMLNACNKEYQKGTASKKLACSIGNTLLCSRSRCDLCSARSECWTAQAELGIHDCFHPAEEGFHEPLSHAAMKPDLASSKSQVVDMQARWCSTAAATAKSASQLSKVQNIWPKKLSSSHQGSPEPGAEMDQAALDQTGSSPHTSAGEAQEEAQSNLGHKVTVRNCRSLGAAGMPRPGIPSPDLKFMDRQQVSSSVQSLGGNRTSSCRGPFDVPPVTTSKLMHEVLS
jgi:hypothetical protein